MRNVGTGAEIDRTGQRVCVLIVQDHPLLASEIAAVVNGAIDLEVVDVSRTGAEALRATVKHLPNVVLMEYRLPDISGPTAAAMILAAYPAAAIVFYSADDSEEALLDAVDVGALGYLTKSTSPGQIVEAVRRAARGDSFIPVDLFVKAIARQRSGVTAGREHDRKLAMFTPREFEVLQLVALGLDTGEMSERLGIAAHTVEWHVRHLIEKLEVHSKLQAVIAATRLGLIDLKDLT
jgi:DNA-binding NarL/FixJ family response regulator